MEHRELKFRAWDGTKMHSVNDAAKELWPLVLPSDAQLEDEGGLKAYRRSWSVMQYTGLRDKNGMDIYEGDILSEGAITGMVVVWMDPLASFALNKVGWMYPNYFVEGVTSAHCTIIGNIHEHPHLLSGGN